MARRSNTFGSNSISAPITGADAVDLTSTDYTTTIPTRAVYVGTAGDLKVTTADGDTVTYANCPAGRHPIQVTKIFKTGTGALGIIAEF
jgi:hypothetical protein